MKLFTRYLKHDIKRIILVVTISLFYALFEGFSIGAIFPLFQFIESQNSPVGKHWDILRLFFDSAGIPFVFSSLIFGLFFIFIIRQVLGYLRNSYKLILRFDFVVRLRDEIFNNIINTDMSYFDNKKAGNLVNTLTTETEKAGCGLFVIIDFLNVIFILCIYFLILLTISWQMTVLTLLIILLASIAMNYKLQISKQYGIEVVELNDTFNNFIVEVLGVIRLVKTSATEKKEACELYQIASSSGSANYRFGMNGVIIVLIFETIIFATILSIFYISIEVLNMSIASVAVFMFIMVRMAPFAQLINNYRHELSGHIASLRNISNIIQETKYWRKIANGTKHFVDLKRNIELRNVIFSYNDSDNVLEGINISITKGKMLAIVGSSGAGKSTLVDLILRFYDPTSGCILVDGVDLREFDIESFRKCIGFVSQDVFLFNDSVAANIGYGLNTVSEKQIVEAAKIAHAHEFIMALPEKYDTILGDRGVKLSGGQRQRLALARAIVRHPQILILDEATSALDTESERLIQDSLNKLSNDYTIIAIAHRLSTIEHADKIIVMENGTVVEEGNHQSLLAKDGYYSKYHKLQFNK